VIQLIDSICLPGRPGVLTDAELYTKDAEAHWICGATLWRKQLTKDIYCQRLIQPARIRILKNADQFAQAARMAVNSDFAHPKKACGD
jgi:hypothetical protein